MRTAYVLGGADCVWGDLRNAIPDQQVPDGLGFGFRLPKDAGFIAVNDIGASFPLDLDAWCTLHGQFFPKWRNARKRNGYAPAKRCYTLTDHEADLKRRADQFFIPANFPDQIHGGSSGLFGVKVALVDLGYDRAVLCGIPMTVTPHFFASKDDNSKGWQDAESYHEGWREALPHLKGRVFSMSGWTRELLGCLP